MRWGEIKCSTWGDIKCSTWGDIKYVTWGAVKRYRGYHVSQGPQEPEQPATLEASTQGGRRGGGDVIRKRDRERGPEEEGPQAPQAPPEGRPEGWLKAGTRVSLGWSAQGPPPEPDARVPALKRAACAS